MQQVRGADGSTYSSDSRVRHRAKKLMYVMRGHIDSGSKGSVCGKDTNTQPFLSLDEFRD